MACYSPKTAIYIPELRKLSFNWTPDSKAYKEAEGIIKRPDGAYWVKIPCRKCIGCRLDYSREWATRIALECKKSDHNWFLTLTYNDKNVPWGETVNMETGEITTNMTLKPEDLTGFLKKLRRHWEYHYGHQGIKFFACGEYGDKTQRPHYHLALMNMPIKEENLKHYANNKQGDEIMTLQEIEDIWGKGFAPIGELNWQSAAYIARYITKKQIGKEAKKWYESQGLKEPFIRVSRNPGIAMVPKDGANEIEKILTQDCVNIATKNGVKAMRTPKIYDMMYSAMEPDQMSLIKEKRRHNAEQATQVKLSQTTLNESAYLKQAGERKEEATKKLLRNI